MPIRDRWTVAWRVCRMTGGTPEIAATACGWSDERQTGRRAYRWPKMDWMKGFVRARPDRRDAYLSIRATGLAKFRLLNSLTVPLP